MTTFDKILAAFLFLVAFPLAIAMAVHWSALVLLASAACIFILFLVPAKRERCKRCGHYYQLNTYDSFIVPRKSKRCTECASESVQTNSGTNCSDTLENLARK